jgi:hypothetical protein
VAKPKGSVPTPKAKPGLVALVGSSLLGAVASHAPQVADVFSVEWALDSGAGEHLASKEALISQGIPSRLLEELETVSSSPLTFSTGGGLKEASMTIRSQGEVLGDGVIYMLKKCPFVKSLGQLVQQGFSFFGGPIMIRLLFQVMLVSVLNVIPPSVLLLIMLTIVFQFFVTRSLSLMGFPPCDLHC